MHKSLCSLVLAAMMASGLSSCQTATGSSSLDREIAAAREQVEELDTARRMMSRGAADGPVSTKEIDKELAAAKDKLEDLETARAMMNRGAAN